MMAASEIKLTLAVAEAQADDERLDGLTGRLMQDLRELGVESIERPSGEAAAEGAKGDPVTLGALALTIVPIVLPKLIEFLQAWALRGEQRRLKIETPDGLRIEFTPEQTLSNAELVALVEKLTHAQA